MQKKESNSLSLYISRSSSWFSRPLQVIAFGIIVGTLVIWSFDGCNIRSNFQDWQDRGYYIAYKLHKPDNITMHHIPPSKENITDHSEPLIMKPSNLGETQGKSHIPNVAPTTVKKSIEWVSAELEANFTLNLMSRWLAPGGELCRDSKTVNIKIPGLDDHKSLKLAAGEVHEFVFQAMDDSGKSRCLGGDYFEVDLSGKAWKSRPLIKDFDDGSYSLKLQVHLEFVGVYNLTIVLLFRHFEGLKPFPHRLVYLKELRRIPITFYESSAQLPGLQICQKSDFVRDVWSGRWTRHAKNEKCKIDRDGRYRCLKADFPCQKPWCNGALGSLESNGWVYSAHCSYKIFPADPAWECLQNRWIFFWGDSNHVDSIRNLLNFVLGLPQLAVDRISDQYYTNPRNKSQTVRITSIFNGHWNRTQNFEGLHSLQNEGYLNLLKKYFSENTVPDTIIMNSGLHDGVYWKSLGAFVQGAEYAVNFWEGIIKSVKQRGLEAPKLLYRTTIAVGGYGRSWPSNPSKMEAFNGVIVDKLRSAGILSGVVDDFDMTFPWHYDNRCSDGPHYGRPPAKAKWIDDKIGHQYFVDLMLGHVLLNYLCA